MLTGEELVAGSTVTYEAEVPPAVLNPGNGAEPAVAGTVRQRPLTVSDHQTITIRKPRRVPSASTSLPPPAYIKAYATRNAACKREYSVLEIGKSRWIAVIATARVCRSK